MEEQQEEEVLTWVPWPARSWWPGHKTFKGHTEPAVLAGSIPPRADGADACCAPVPGSGRSSALTGPDIFSYLDLKIFCSNSCKLHFTEEETESVI